jgi:hypothetical protein
VTGDVEAEGLLLTSQSIRLGPGRYLREVRIRVTNGRVASAEEGSEDHKGFLYDLGDLYLSLGKELESQETFLKLYEIDSEYRNVSSRISPRRGGAPPSGEGEDQNPSSSSNSKVSYL